MIESRSMTKSYTISSRGVYYCTVIRPNINHIMNKLCQLLHGLTSVHWISAKRLLRYLKGIQEHGIIITKSNSLVITVYTDVNWTSNTDDQHFTGDHYIYLDKSLILWHFGKHKVVSHSSTKVEFWALASDPFGYKIYYKNFDSFFTHPLQFTMIMIVMTIWQRMLFFIQESTILILIFTSLVKGFFLDCLQSSALILKNMLQIS